MKTFKSRLLKPLLLALSIMVFAVVKINRRKKSLKTDLRYIEDKNAVKDR